MQTVGNVSVYRPEEYRIAPLAKFEVSESCVNRYSMKIDPLSFDEQRASFSWRQPGIGTLMSPNVFLEVSYKVRFPGHADFKTFLAPTFQLMRAENVIEAGAADAVEVVAAGCAPKIAFGSGDAFGGCITNYQIQINGASLSNSRLNTYKQVLDRCWYGEQVFQMRFSQCGGAQDQYDAVPVSGECIGADNGAQAGKLCGFTGDSGLQQRIKNVIGCTEKVPPVARFTPDEEDVRIVRIRWPVNGAGILNPIGATKKDQLASSCPYRQSCVALPHMSVVSLDILMEDMKECLFRNLTGRVNAVGGNSIANRNTRSGIQVTLLNQNNDYGVKGPQLHVEYLRLGSWRGIPERAALQCFRIAVHEATSLTGTGTVTIPAASTRGGVNDIEYALQCVGTDRGSGALARTAGWDDAVYLEASWHGVVSAQVPSYLCFMLSKTSKMFVLGGVEADDALGKSVSNYAYLAGVPAAGGSESGLFNYFRARNTDASATIMDFSLEVQSSLGAYTYSDESFPFLRTKHELWRDHLKNVADDYCSGDIDKWSRHQCCLLLSASDYIRGLASDGSSFPITLTAKVKFISTRQFVCGSAASSLFAGAGGPKRGPAVFRDTIAGTPVMLQIYPKSSLQVSPSSAILSSQNLSHAQSMDLIMRGGSQ